MTFLPTSDRMRRLFAGLAAAMGFVSMLGWVTGVEALASLHARYIPMAPSTALCFALFGVALACHPRPRWLLGVGTFAVIATAALRLVETATGWPVALDGLLGREGEWFGIVPKGQMSPITAAGFLVAASGTVPLALSRGRGGIGISGTAMVSLAVVVLLGYLHNAPLLYVTGVVPVALSTAFAFFFLGVALLAAAGQTSWPGRSWSGHSARALLLRWFLPLVAGGSLVNGIIRAWFMQHTTVNPALVSALSTLLFAAVITAIVSKVATKVGGQLDAADQARLEAQAELEKLNRHLEERIEARTLELRTKNSQMQEDLRMARELQLAMLPKQFPSVPESVPPAESAVRFHTFYQPSGGVSGDFFSVFPVAGNRVGIFICDVMGHGVRAALVTSMMRVLMEQHSAAGDADPGMLLSRINRGMVAILRQTGTTLFATALVVIADVASGALAFANAGHPSPLRLRRRVGKAEPLSGTSGPALGIFPDVEYKSLHAPLEPQDLVLMFTDGLFEAEAVNGDLYSYEQLQAAVERRHELPAERLFDETLAEIRRFADGRDFADDVCLVGIELTAAARQLREAPREAGAELVKA